MAEQKPYDEIGAMNGLFAPAYIAGNEQSQAAVAKWMADHYGMTNDIIEQSRMPNPPVPAPAANPYGGFRGGVRGVVGGMGGTGGGNLNVGDPRGTVDPEALRILAQGGKYDLNARRNAIAKQLMASGG